MAHDGSGAGKRRPGCLASFEGVWRLEKTIQSDQGPDGHFTGTASFTRSGPGLLIQDEEGMLAMGQGAPLHATRRYLWRERAGVIEVSFQDNRPFHVIPLSADAPQAVHICPPDRYEVLYDFEDWPNWTAIWTVEGPRKGYVMQSSYRRQSLDRRPAAVQNASNEEQES